MRETFANAIHIFGWLVIVVALFLSLCFGLSFSLPLWAHGSIGFMPALALALLIAVVSFAVFVGLAAFTFQRRASKEGTETKAFGNPKLVLLVSFVFIWASYFFALLSVYPGFCSNDSMVTINQALGNFDPNDMFLRDGLSNHQPVIYTAIVALISFITGTTDIEHIAFITILLQMTFMAIMLAWSVSWLDRHACPRLLLVFIVAAVALCPVFIVHAITLWKDGPFCVLLLAFALRSYDVAMGQKLQVRDAVSLGMLALFASLFRNNGFYIVVVSLLILLILSPAARKHLAVCLCALAAVYLVIQGPIFSLAGVKPSPFAESVGIPLQQIALVSIEDGLEPEQAEFMEPMIPVERMNSVYLSYSANPIKFDEDFNNEYLEAHKGQFLATWASVVRNHPATALKAWVLHTEGIWSFSENAEIGTSSSYNETSPVDLIGLGWDPRDLFNRLQRHFPILFSKGLLVWAVAWIGMFSFAIQKKQRKGVALVFLPALVLFLTMMIAIPSGWDYRYVLYYAMFLPYALYFVTPAVGQTCEDGTGSLRQHRGKHAA